MRHRLALLCCLAALLAACRRSDLSGANVVVIGIDTLRADHLGCYGYPRPTSPHIDALAADGTLFTTAIAQSPWTLPSFASMFTGLLPSAHRAGEGQGMARSRLDARFPTLATELRRAGWRTGSFVSNGYAGENVGLGEGFERRWQWLESALSVQQAEAFIREHAGERFFAFIHLVDPHQPYAPSDEDAAPFIDPAYEGPIGRDFGGLPRAGWSDADRRRIVDLYDGDVRTSDRWVGRIVDLLRGLGVLERTIVVVVSDHGEELFDHKLLGHGHTLYDELLHVPLVIRFPHGRWKGRVETQVRAMDLFPTLLDAVGLPVPPDLDGISRMPLLRGTPPPAAGDVALAEYLFLSPEQKAARRPGFKVVFTPLRNVTAAYDLAADPREQADVANGRAADVAALRIVLEREVLAHLEGFQIAARSGNADHVVRLRVESPSGFADVGLVHPEPDDSVTTSGDGRSLEVTLHLPAYPAKDIAAGDDDILRFQVRDAQPLTVNAELDGKPYDPHLFFLGSFRAVATGPPPWGFAQDDSRLVVPFPPVLPPSQPGDVRVALYRVVRPAAPVATLDEKTRESLRQLGYIQ